jgi:hypothetical protein
VKGGLPVNLAEDKNHFPWTYADYLAIEDEYRIGDTIESPTFPGLQFPVRDLFPEDTPD